jgi:hypothetical protein
VGGEWYPATPISSRSFEWARMARVKEKPSSGPKTDGQPGTTKWQKRLLVNAVTLYVVFQRFIVSMAAGLWAFVK